MRGTRGFTVIEALIVVAIISILAAVAWPSYQTYVRRAERSKAQQLMLEIANREQQYIVDARAYTATIGSGGLNVPNKEGWTCSGLTCTGPRYTITVTVATPPPPGFTITATPTGQQAVDGTMTFNNIGAKTRVVGGVDRGWTGP